MHILISNDDGYKSKGIQVLINELKKIAQITVVAPSRNRSGASSSLSLDRSIKVTKKEDSFYFLSGTPTDCVHIALTGLMQTLPDMVISGINHGPNLGDDTIYSGTVAAAIEGYLLDIPSFAISMGSVNPKHFETAAKVTSDLIKLYNKKKVSSASLLNINVPPCSIEECKGIKITKAGYREYGNDSHRHSSPRGEEFYWIGLHPLIWQSDEEKGCDFEAVKDHYVSITPVQLDMTSYSDIDKLKGWLSE